MKRSSAGGAKPRLSVIIPTYNRAGFVQEASQVQRRSAPVDVTALTPAMERIAGDLLRQLGYLPANHNGEG